MYIKVFKTFCLAPQTEIPLTGEMSRSDKRVTARYEQLEPVTLNMLSSTAVASLYRYDKTIHRIVLSATDNSRVPLLQCDVAGERTVQRCRQKQKDRTSCDLFMCLGNENQTTVFLLKFALSNDSMKTRANFYI